ncbi:MAG TPA: alanine--tRNA ligase [Anaerolineae bacterium]|nr:alanine--tRNA ligase [Anaerolineae bacterium]
MTKKSTTVKKKTAAIKPALAKTAPPRRPRATTPAAPVVERPHFGSAQIRQMFLDFFAERGHTIVPSMSLLPTDDPTLLFTNSGMVQFKDVFLGIGRRPYTRVADAQKCMRVAGKHNDLDDVGRDGSHHTFFEMLGNWSFGDYYKKEAITWAWQLLTEVWSLPQDRLWATCFEDEKGEIPRDDEAAGDWRQQPGFDPAHLLFFGRKENFWEMADTGPCGPDSEIHFDRGLEFCDQQGVRGHVCRVNGDCPRFLELWNLVFIQYNRINPTTLEPLPARHVDTGLGFERIVAVLQQAKTNYATDLFMPLIRRTQELTGQTDAEMQQNIVAYRVIADHGRGAAFLVADGVLPGNVGRNYVLRMIIRRAARFGRKLGLDFPFLAEIADAVIEQMGDHYRELRDRREHIAQTLTDEEERFRRTLDLGLSKLEDVLHEAKNRVVPGQEAFKLYDTFGLPLEITKDVALERGYTVDEVGYQKALAEQRERARAGEKFEMDDQSLAVYHRVLRQLQSSGVLSEAGVEHDPYTAPEMETAVVGLLAEGGELVDQVKPEEKVEVILAATPFYVESGGQLSDTGVIARFAEQGNEPVWQIEVTDTRRPIPGLIVHTGKVKSGRPRVGELAWALVDFERRWDIMRNHTATHLLHAELRYVLGAHVHQAGSLVAPERLRFDFTHSTMLTQDELEALAENVNSAILANYPVIPTLKSYQEAVAEGAMALFGEKYGEIVRVVRTGWPDDRPVSLELCGGTHVNQTAEIGPFVVMSEGSVGAGVRRIEALTGRGAQRYIYDRLNKLTAAAAFLNAPPEEIDRKVLLLLEENQMLHKQLGKVRRESAQREMDALLSKVEQVNGVAVLSAQVKVETTEMLREMSDWFRDRLRSAVVVLGAEINRRPSLIAAVTPDLVTRGLDAGKIVRQVAQLIGGGGGGKPTLAEAGGKDVARLTEALATVSRIVAESVQ